MTDDDDMTEDEFDEQFAAGEPVDVYFVARKRLASGDAPTVPARDALGFFEPDEPVEEVIAAYEAGDKGVTAPPDRSWITLDKASSKSPWPWWASLALAVWAGWLVFMLVVLPR